MTQMTDAAYTKTYEESEALRQAVKDARLNLETVEGNTTFFATKQAHTAAVNKAKKVFQAACDAANAPGVVPVAMSPAQVKEAVFDYLIGELNTVPSLVNKWETEMATSANLFKTDIGHANAKAMSDKAAWMITTLFQAGKVQEVKGRIQGRFQTTFETADLATTVEMAKAIVEQARREVLQLTSFEASSTSAAHNLQAQTEAKAICRLAEKAQDCLDNLHRYDANLQVWSFYCNSR